MEYSCLQLNDLPDEILLIIFKKVNNVALLYSLFDVNKRLNKILHDPIFTSHLSLLNCHSSDCIYRLSGTILDRYCLQILPKIHHKLEWLNLESSSMTRILLCTDYPKLCGLGLYNLDRQKAIRLVSDETLLFHKFKSKILSLVIKMSRNGHISIEENANTFIFTHIFTMFTNLQYLNFASSCMSYQILSFDLSPPSVFSSNLLELHVNLDRFNDCLYLLDGRFNQLRKLYVNIYEIIPSRLVIDNKEKLSNLRCFGVYSDLVIYTYDELIVPLLHRMSNLDELTLDLTILDRKTFVDGNNLKDIIDHMVQLKKFTFNIHSTITLNNQINLPSNENIQNSFKDFKHNQIICCVNYFSEKLEGLCRIYSCPYISKVCKNITNSFSGGLFECVREISLFDEQPFEHEFFLRIAQSFPLMKKLTLVNRKAQKNKSKDDHQDLTIAKYSHLKDIDLYEAHEDYIEQFLLNTKTWLLYNVELVTNHQLLEKVTHNFRRDATSINCSKIDYLYDNTICSLPKHFNKYFFHTCAI
ncbi:unnamed protein product [Rotaria sp. Silwood2]|nr:unnamed protein product [Rotaria sp. Silwood2]CAF3122927.1 unnamed protein product [Rotaria sp. Silwood2]CAF3426032.1 unnamed protein product [Rotaria sp. Silwood2]CAF4426058.1 unnamed protein product [Rotaria sp. Silwood2]CAF4473591.1 unnamed protein product [Rotaria sp. Silwood2]